MEMHRDDFELSSELRALRPSPSSAFADELDARVAAGFAKAGESEEGLLDRIARVLRNSSPRRLMLPAGAVALTAIVVATAVIAIGETENEISAPNQVVDARGSIEREVASGHPPASSGGRGGQGGFEYSDGPPASSLSEGASTASPSAGYQSSGPTSKYQTSAAEPAAGRRAVERDAELVLQTQPGEIGKASREIFDAVHAANGVVLSSSVRDQGGESSARFQLLVPSARLGDALASLSQIAEVRSRHESTRDITAPTTGVETQLADSRARIDGLLTQLASAESEEERVAVETELRSERKRVAVLHSQLDQIRRRADFAEVSLRIESGAVGDSGSATWGIGDALDDAGHILTIAAGVAVVGLAVLGPLVLIGLLLWLASRVWVRHQRQRALS